MMTKPKIVKNLDKILNSGKPIKNGPLDISPKDIQKAEKAIKKIAKLFK